MRISILIGFCYPYGSFSIMAPAVITLLDTGEQSVVVLCHNEEEQQESGEKDKVEEKISSGKVSYKVVISSDQWRKYGPYRLV